ncbi:fibronectin type III domain-containing protein [uncultured Halomonas sp.]|uniref:fibronectin type III domain-containing protein n=1 Tax=uncultured Halomonas sp. TaxID=173971 RepID=UPI002626D5CE|nr:fibronectin type III domain-containing protein [uncultured Halomonas sp.]
MAQTYTPSTTGVQLGKGFYRIYLHYGVHAETDTTITFFVRAVLQNYKNYGAHASTWSYMNTAQVGTAYAKWPNPGDYSASWKNRGDTGLYYHTYTKAATSKQVWIGGAAYVENVETGATLGSLGSKQIALLTIPALAPPKPVVNLTAKRNSDTQITVTWAAGAGGYTKFEVQRSVNGSGYTKLADATTVSYIDKSVAAGSRYSYRVKQVSAGGSSAFVSTRTIYGYPLSVTDVAVARATDTHGTVTWTNNSSVARPYSSIQIRRRTPDTNWVDVATVASGATFWHDYSLWPNTQYSYAIKAINDEGESPWAYSSTLRTTPYQPKNVVATKTGPRSADVTWDDASGSETGFEVRRSLDNGATWQVLGTTMENARKHIDTNAPAGAVLYSVAAVADTLKSPYVNSNTIYLADTVTFSQVHPVDGRRLITKVAYNLTYIYPVNEPARIEVWAGGVGGTLLASGSYTPWASIPVNKEVTGPVTVVVKSPYPLEPGTSWTIDVYDALEDNNWTFLGYADNQLVGTTANSQMWTGPFGSNMLENAKKIPDPTAANAFAMGSLTPYGLTINATSTAETPFRISIQYTILNKFGPTLPTPMFTFYASKPTTEWSSSSYVKVSGGVADGYQAKAVELYFSEGEYREANFLTRVNLPADGNGTKNWSYPWKGYDTDPALWTMSNLSVPTDNFTSGVPASHMRVIDGRAYFWGNKEHPYRIWAGGNPGNRFSVSPGVGGGFVDVDPGIGTFVTDVLKFKTQQGASIVTALTDNPNSQREARYNLVESRIDISNEQSTQGFVAERVAGTVGCKSGRGALATGDGLYAVSRYGLAITTLTMEYNSQLQVMYVSDNIEPVFLKQYGNQLKGSVLLESNGVLYMTFGAPDGSLDNMLFCYDISLKAWWTHTLDIDEPILNMIHIDHEGSQEGVGIITPNAVYMLPTTLTRDLTELPTHNIHIESGELSTAQPLQATHHLSQLELRFDYFVGDLDVKVTMIDQFGREVVTEKRIHHDSVQRQLSEYIRIDQVVESYKILITGKANMRLTHFISKLYPKPARTGMVWGFDSRQSHTSSGSIHKTFLDYNDVKNAIIP